MAALAIEGNQAFRVSRIEVDRPGPSYTLETLEALTVIGIVYLALVWSLSAAIRVLEGRLALPETR